MRAHMYIDTHMSTSVSVYGCVGEEAPHISVHMTYIHIYLYIDICTQVHLCMSMFICLDIHHV